MLSSSPLLHIIRLHHVLVPIMHIHTISPIDLPNPRLLDIIGVGSVAVKQLLSNLFPGTLVRNIREVKPIRHLHQILVSFSLGGRLIYLTISDDSETIEAALKLFQRSNIVTLCLWNDLPVSSRPLVAWLQFFPQRRTLFLDIWSDFECGIINALIGNSAINGHLCPRCPQLQNLGISMFSTNVKIFQRLRQVVQNHSLEHLSLLAPVL
jgi:hypothetical protein